MSSTNKYDNNDITEIVLEVALNSMILSLVQFTTPMMEI